MTAPARAHVLQGIRLALAHHPLCSVYDPDVFRLRALRICSGCAVALPAFLLGIILSIPLLARVGAWVALAAGLALGSAQLATYVRRGGRLSRAAAKLSGGIGLGIVLVTLLVLPVPLWLRVAGAAALSLAFVGLQALRMRSIVATCRRCPWAMRWDECPGFAPGTLRAPYVRGSGSPPT